MLSKASWLLIKSSAKITEIWKIGKKNREQLFAILIILAPTANVFSDIPHSINSYGDKKLQQQLKQLKVTKVYSKLLVL